jgi:shikimate kinase
MPCVVLIGPPGSGKSTVGKALARKLNCAFRDTDTEVETVAGKSVSAIFVEDGEKRFRELEERVVLENLTSFDGVLALGGGSVMTESVAGVLRGNQLRVVYLEVSLAQAAPRVGFNKDRPLLLVNPRAQWQALMEVRRPTYESLATKKFSTDSAKAPEIADNIIATFGLTQGRVS